jgi:hypothetical protein
VAEIQRKIIKQGKRNAASRLVHAKNDKDTIATWRSDLARILLVFNVSSVVFGWPLLTIHSQTELAINTHVTVSDIRHNVVNTHTIVSDVHHDVMDTHALVSNVRSDVLNTHTIVSDVQHDVANTHSIVSDVHHGVVNTHAIVSELQHNVANTHAVISDIHRTVVGIQEGTNGQNPLVSIFCTPFNTEQTLTVA